MPTSWNRLNIPLANISSDEDVPRSSSTTRVSEDVTRVFS